METRKIKINGLEPAFPFEPDYTLDCDIYPRSLLHQSKGMSKRFYAACAAMQGILANIPTKREDVILFLTMKENAYGNIPVNEAIIKEAYIFADEILKQENL